jgi:hypothetical protein
MKSSRPAAPIIAKYLLKPHSDEASDKAKDALLCADIVHVDIHALNAAPSDFPPATLGFLLSNADRIYGIADCCAATPGYWETLIESMTFPKLEDGRFTVRLLASDPEPWEELIALHSPKGAFCIASPIYREASAAA